MGPYLKKISKKISILNPVVEQCCCTLCRWEGAEGTASAGISPCWCAPAHFPSFLHVLEEKILLGQHSIASVAALVCFRQGSHQLPCLINLFYSKQPPKKPAKMLLFFFFLPFPSCSCQRNSGSLSWCFHSFTCQRSLLVMLLPNQIL